jgi:hypothetical protein
MFTAGETPIFISLNRILNYAKWFKFDEENLQLSQILNKINEK